MKEVSKYEVLVATKQLVRKCHYGVGNTYICVALGQAIATCLKIHYASAKKTMLWNQLQNEVLSYMPRPEDSHIALSAWALEDYLRLTEPDKTYSLDEIQAKRHEILDKMIWNHANEAQRKVILLNWAKVWLYTAEDFECGGKHVYLCNAVSRAAREHGCKDIRSSTVEHEIHEDISKAIGHCVDVQTYIGSMNPVLTQPFRFKLIDTLIAKYEAP